MKGIPRTLPRHLLLFLLLLFGVLLAVSCEKEDGFIQETVPAHNEDLPISIVTTTFEEAGEKFKQIASQHDLENHKRLISLGGIEKSSSGGIVIISEEVKEIRRGDYTSYTMLIASRDIASNVFYNLTIEEVRGVTKMFITKYVPTQEWLANNNMPFHGQITTFRINDLQTALDRVDTPINSGGEGGGTNTYPTDCNGSVIATVVVVEVPCPCEGHRVGQYCEGCSIGALPYNEYKTVYECVGGNPFTNPPGGVPGTTNPPTGGPGGGPGNTTPPPTSPAGNDPSLTTPVGPKDGAASASPCGELKKLIVKNSIQQSLRIIKSKASSSGEFGYYFSETTSTSGETYISFPVIPKDDENPTKLQIGAGLDTGNVIGAGHCHTDPVSTGGVPMFSHDDVYALWKIARRHQSSEQPKNYSLYTVMLSVGSGHYALKFKNFQSFENGLRNIGNFSKFSKELINRYKTSTATANSTVLIKDFLKSLNEYKLSGIGLYMATESINTNGESIITDWKELSLNQNGAVEEIPCL